MEEEKNDTKITIEKHEEEVEDSQSQELGRKKPTPLVSQTTFFAITGALFGSIFFIVMAQKIYEYFKNKKDQNASEEPEIDMVE